MEKQEPLKIDWTDAGLIKIAVFALALLIAKRYKPILGLKWYWYMMIWVAAAIRPFTNFYRWLRLAIRE